MPDLAEKLDDILVRYLAYINYKKYVDNLNLKGNEKIIEIGCSSGNLSRFLIKKLPFGKLTCIDNSEYWIERAKNKLNSFKNIEFRIMDILKFHRKNYFDVAILHYMLHDMIEKEKVIKIINKNLKEGGIIYIREPTRKGHGINIKEIEDLLIKENFVKIKSIENYSFPLKGKVYEGIFRKT